MAVTVTTQTINQLWWLTMFLQGYSINWQPTVQGGNYRTNHRKLVAGQTYCTYRIWQLPYLPRSSNTDIRLERCLINSDFWHLLADPQDESPVLGNDGTSVQNLAFEQFGSAEYWTTASVTTIRKWDDEFDHEFGGERVGNVMHWWFRVAVILF